MYIGGQIGPKQLQPNKGINLTAYSALLRCAEIFTSPKRTVTGRLSRR